MSDHPAPRTARNIPALLLALRQEEFNGAVTVSGSPGGTIHLERGLVLAIETPGTPTAETLLLRSGRISEAAWNAALAATGSTDGRLERALIAEGALSAAELEIICAAAAFDGAFAMALSTPTGWQVTESATPPALALRPGLEPQQLFDETTHRRTRLTALWGPPAELSRTRFRAATRSGNEAARIHHRHQDLLAAATGRNTPRDIGFALGRGLFAVMLDLARLDARRLLHADQARPADTAPSVAPRTPPAGRPTATVGPLPRRTPGHHAPAAQHAPHSPTTPAEPPIASSTEKGQP